MAEFLLLVLLFVAEMCGANGIGAATVFELKSVGKGTAMVADPAASEGVCVALCIGDETGSGATNTWKLEAPKLVPGLYRASVRLRWHGPQDFNRSRLSLNLKVSEGAARGLDLPLMHSVFDETPGAYTEVSGDVLLLGKGAVTLEGSWAIGPPPPGQRNVSARPLKGPKLADRDFPGASGAGSRDADELEGLVSRELVRPLAEIADPALLLDRITLEPLSTTLIIDKVWPEKVHVYPGETNPVTVTVRNLGGEPAQTVLRLDLLTGLDETGACQQVGLTVPGKGLATHRFEWISRGREYGHEARATVFVAGKPVHSASEYFSVSSPIWKTAIQGSGFISWAGREDKLASHVDDNRRAYINVEEAFSWQPSSWNDLNPTQAEWSAGQNNYHNSLAGLQEWLARSHSNGIKMITYSWPTVSGRSGFDWGRRHPDLLTRQTGGSGLAAVVDLEDLELYDVTHSRREFRYHQSGIWLNIGVNLGYLRSMHLHAQEVVRSARRFGWDGLRFDYPPRWSPMDTSCVNWEFQLLGVSNVMRRLMPEYIDTTNRVWSSEAISVRNVRYVRQVFKEELGPHFALSYNDGTLAPLTADQTFWFREYCREGGQIMNEAIRGTGSMTNYLSVLLRHTEATRAAGGYGNVFMAEKCPDPLASVYSGIFTFAAGSHPYLDYGWMSMPGTYTRLMTRYGEYYWDLALAPVDAVAAGLKVEDGGKPLLWTPFIRQRHAGEASGGERLPRVQGQTLLQKESRQEIGGPLQTVVQLVNPPEWSPAKAATQYAAAWRHDVVVRKRCAAPPTVWWLTAEPALSAARLTVRPDGEFYAVTVPEIRYWATLVWSEKP